MFRAAKNLAVAFFSIALLAGCVSRSRAQNETQKAFRAGEAEGAILADAKRNGISFTGQVLVPVVQWQEGLTLAQAILAARWTGRQDPRKVIITNPAGERMEMTIEESVMMGEFPLHPGDAVELVP